MQVIRYPSSHRSLLQHLDAAKLSVEIYQKLGVFVLRKIIPADQIVEWQRTWREFYEGVAKTRDVNPFNPVLLNEVVPGALAEIHRCPVLLDIMEHIYPNLALYMQRFVIKDAQSEAPVFLHQDFGYDHGWPEKTSVFLPLSPVSAYNGGVAFYPSTHIYGYLGDVGEIDPNIIDPEWPAICPSLEPGDIALMHECTWHASGPRIGGPDRILVQITYQPAIDPTGVTLLRGHGGSEYRPNDFPREKIFKRSRTGRLRELQSEVNQLNAARVNE